MSSTFFFQFWSISLLQRNYYFHFPFITLEVCFLQEFRVNYAIDSDINNVLFLLTVHNSTLGRENQDSALPFASQKEYLTISHQYFTLYSCKSGGITVLSQIILWSFAQLQVRPYPLSAWREMSKIWHTSESLRYASKCPWKATAQVHWKKAVCPSASFSAIILIGFIKNIVSA